MNNEQLEYFYGTVSFAGLISLYAFKLSLNRNMAFDKNDFTEKIDLLPDAYFHGFIVACSSMNILSYNFKKTIFTVTKLDPLLDQTLEEQISKSSKKEKYWEEQLELVREYFQ